MTITEARSIVKDFVSNWSDFKIASVLAFAEDGRMSYTECCTCLIGVHFAEVLHVAERCPDYLSHRKLYETLHSCGIFVIDPEKAYRDLGIISPERGGREYSEPLLDELRNKEFIAILRSVIAERDAQSAHADEAQPVEIAQESAK